MNEKLQEELFAIKPEWFVRNNPRRSLMCFGFSVGDGWFPLLKTLLTVLVDSVETGGFEVVQVKEKFGGLRFYTNIAPKCVLEVINFAEVLSFTICENCGTMSGVFVKGSWSKALCDSCREERNK